MCRCVAMRPTDQDRLARAGRLLLGLEWQRPLARALDIDDRLVRRWVAGERPIPAWVWPALAMLARERLAGAQRDLKALTVLASS